MAIPIAIDCLLETQVVEYARSEFKKSWDVEPILHTLCAFANDIDNSGGGYISIGVEEKNGMPVFPVTGVSPESLDHTMKELLRISKEIKPDYVPICEPVVCQGKHLLLIWAPGGHDRPYDCPERPFEKNSQRSFYIRKLSSTLKASKADVKELHAIGGNIPYDDRINLNADLNDMKVALIRDYLFEVGSSLMHSIDFQTLQELAQNMRIADGPADLIKM